MYLLSGGSDAAAVQRKGVNVPQRRRLGLLFIVKGASVEFLPACVETPGGLSLRFFFFFHVLLLQK